MTLPSPPSWTPTGLFALLALYFLDKAVRTGARRSWGWGRTLEAAPISRTGYAVISLTFLDIAAMLAWSPRPPRVLIVVFLVCFLTLGVIGHRDTREYRRRRK